MNQNSVESNNIDQMLYKSDHMISDLNISNDSNQMVLESNSKINFDSCHYRDLINPENQMNDLDVVMSRPTSIDTSQNKSRKSFLDKHEYKSNKFKVINHQRKKKLTRGTRKNQQSMVNNELTYRSK